MKKFIVMLFMSLILIGCSSIPTPDITQVVDSTAVEIVQPDTPTSPFSGGDFWLWVIGVLIGVLSYLQHAMPSDGKAKSIINLFLKVLEIAKWLLVKAFPDKNKEGGVHIEVENPFKKKK